MGDLIVTGASPRELRAAAQKNHVIKICHGLYVTRQPTAHELCAIVSTRWPRAALTGETAVQVFLGEECYVHEVFGLGVQLLFGLGV